MILSVKYFFETNKETYDTYNKVWDAYNDKIILLTSMPGLVRDLATNSNKTILALRFPSFVKCKNILKQIKENNGIRYDNDKIWYPSEIWIFSPE